MIEASSSPPIPETVIPYYPDLSFVQPPYRMATEHHRPLEQSVTAPSATTEAIGEACRQAGMVGSIGVNERDGGTIYNTQLFSGQLAVSIRQHALEFACFVVNATAWLDPNQQERIMRGTGCPNAPISSGCFTALVSPPASSSVSPTSPTRPT